MRPFYRVLKAVAALAVLGALVSPAAAQCEDLEAKVKLLTRQIETMQKQIMTLKAQQKSQAVAPAATAAPATAQRRAVPVKKVAAPSVDAAAKPDAAAAAKNRAAAARGAGREEAVALYDRIDGLLGDSQIDAARKELEDFNTQYEGTPAAAWTRSLGREMTAVGKPAPDDWFIERWFQGESDVDLSGEAPTVLIFWESWCPHCKSEVPKLQAMYDTYRSRGLQFVGVTRLTRTSTAEEVEAFLRDNNVTYPIAKETGSLAEYFSVKGIPAAAVVKGGQVVWRGHPTRLKPELLERWL